jgi:hypothetical protein
MDKKSLIVISLCIMIFLILCSQNAISLSKDNDFINVTTQAESIKIYSGEVNNVTSYHGNISGAKYWYAIKINFSGAVIIQVEIYTKYTSNGSRINSFFNLYNPIYDEGYLYRMERWSSGVNPDYYFKTQLGDWNWSWHHEGPVGDNWGEEHIIAKIWCSNVSPYLITFISYTTNRNMDIWVNTSSDSNVTYSTSWGTDVFAYDRYDFSGIVNIGSKRGTLIINGQKNIQINNRLFAWFTTGLVSTGFETLKYKSPTGDSEWKYFKDRKGEHIYINESENFQKGLWWGTNGTWIFNVNMLDIGLKKNSPNIYLLGADIKFPE